MELQSSRLRARVDASGDPIRLLDQNRARWDRLLIARGLAALRRGQGLAGEPGPYLLQAAIAACHATAPAAEDTDWHRIAGIPNLSVFGTDPYWLISKKDLSYVETSCRLVKEVCDSHGLEAQAWLQGFRIPAGKEPELVEALEVMVAAGITNISVWGFLACEHLSWIRPDNAPLAWQTIKDAYRTLRRRFPLLLRYARARCDRLDVAHRFAKRLHVRIGAFAAQATSALWH